MCVAGYVASAAATGIELTCHSNGTWTAPTDASLLCEGETSRADSIPGAQYVNVDCCAYCRGLTANAADPEKDGENKTSLKHT